MDYYHYFLLDRTHITTNCYKNDRFKSDFDWSTGVLRFCGHIVDRQEGEPSNASFANDDESTDHIRCPFDGTH
jgi:hypothetical protein